MYARFSVRDGFWLHLSRVMTRHAYDDSYWIPPDEIAAWERSFPLRIER